MCILLYGDIVTCNNVNHLIYLAFQTSICSSDDDIKYNPSGISTYLINEAPKTVLALNCSNK